MQEVQLTIEVIKKLKTPLQSVSPLWVRQAGSKLIQIEGVKTTCLIRIHLSPPTRCIDCFHFTPVLGLLPLSRVRVRLLKL